MIQYRYLKHNIKLNKSGTGQYKLMTFRTGVRESKIKNISSLTVSCASQSVLHKRHLFWPDPDPQQRLTDPDSQNLLHKKSSKCYGERKHTGLKKFCEH